MNDLEKEVSKLLLDLNVPYHLKGYEYLKTAIIMCYKDRNKLHCITKSIYPAIIKNNK